jgi:hypothetical protein
MRVCGLSISSSEVRVVTLEGTRSSHVRIADDLHKIPIHNTESPGGIAAVTTPLVEHIRGEMVTRIGIKANAATGKFSAGANVFRVEGALLAVVEAEFSFFHSATLASIDRKQGELKTGKPSTAVLATAYDLAFACLE